MSIKLREYLAQTERSYNYRIKTVVPITDTVMDRIERCLAKYMPVSVGRIVKTMFQRNPLDFPGIDHAEVYYLDVSTRLPASSYVLQQDIRFAMGIPEKYIVVRAENEPTEVETQHLNAVADLEDEAKKKGLTHAALLDNPEYPEANDVDAEDFYGDRYNSNLTDYLAKIAAERESMLVQTANAPFDWLDLKDNELSPKQDETDFNVSMKKPEAGGKKLDLSTKGNLDNNDAEYKKLYKNKDGKTQVLKKSGIAVAKKD